MNRYYFFSAIILWLGYNLHGMENPQYDMAQIQFHVHRGQSAPTSWPQIVKYIPILQEKRPGSDNYISNISTTLEKIEEVCDTSNEVGYETIIQFFKAPRRRGSKQKLVDQKEEKISTTSNDFVQFQLPNTPSLYKGFNYCITTCRETNYNSQNWEKLCELLSITGLKEEKRWQNAIKATKAAYILHNDKNNKIGFDTCVLPIPSMQQ